MHLDSYSRRFLILNFAPDQSGEGKSIELDPNDRGMEGFNNYRQEIETQLRFQLDVFRDCFLSALRMYPGLNYNDFRIRIWIDISKKKDVNSDSEREDVYSGSEIKVVDVTLDGLPDKKLRGKIMEPEGNIVLEFKANYPKSCVRFSVEKRVRLGEEQLLETKKGYRKAADVPNVASEISKALSDEETDVGHTWRLFPEVYRKIEPSGWKKIPQLFRSFRA